MESIAAFEEPIATKIHQTQYEEEEGEGEDAVGDLERKTSAFHRQKRTVSSDSSTITAITTSDSSSPSSSSSSAGTDIFCTDEPNGKELSVDQSNAGEVETPEVPELQEQDKDLGFHGEHSDEKNDNVYFDGEQGIWKCRHCDWTYREESVLCFDSKGSEPNGAADALPDALEPHADDNVNGERNESDNENGSIITDNGQSHEIEEMGVRGSPQDPQVLHQSGAADAIEEEVDIEADGYEVEKVLENQETHDLFCPYCDKCITKKVVLKRRKRKIPREPRDPKRGKLDIPTSEPTGSSPLDHTQAIDHGEESKEGPCVFLFQCLSCFGIFSSEKLPRDSTELGTPLIPQPTTTVKPSWFNFIFGSKDKETPGGEVTATEVSPQGELDSSTETTTGSAAKDPLEAQDSVGSGATATIPDGLSKTIVPVQLVEAAVLIQGDNTRDGLGFVASLAGKEPSVRVVLSPIQPSGTVEVSDKSTVIPKEVKTDADLTKIVLSPIQPSGTMDVLDKSTIRPEEVKPDPDLTKIVVSEPYGSSTTKLDSAPINKTEDTLEIISDPGHVGAEPSGSPLDNDPAISLLPSGTETASTPSGEVAEEHKLEILKSIVYGGLVESLTSLGVISSAAGSGASTLNIFVLGLANLVGGLILIVHNLKELREEKPRTTASDGNQVNKQEEDRYKRLLGRRENFRVHATVAILTFIIAGLIPPVVYGFSFRESNNRDYKALSVLAASLVCIFFLAIAEAHVKTPRESYPRSVLYYATIAISGSGVSYFVGDIVSKLLEKYGWSDGPGSPAELMLPLLGRKAGFGYSSY